MNAWDLMTSETLAFMEEHLPPAPARLLEVGCGLGHVAQALGERGYEVVGVDPKESVVEAARARGVDARLGALPRRRWGVFQDDARESYDAVLFTRSLHHLATLSRVVDAVDATLLAPEGGVVLVEDWAWDEVDVRTAEWLYGFMAFGKELGWVPADEWTWGETDGIHTDAGGPST